MGSVLPDAFPGRGTRSAHNNHIPCDHRHPPSSAPTQQGSTDDMHTPSFKGPRKRPSDDSRLPWSSPSTDHQLWAVFPSVPYQPSSLRIPKQCLILLFPWFPRGQPFISVIKSLMKSLSVKCLVQSWQIVCINTAQATRACIMWSFGSERSEDIGPGFLCELALIGELVMSITAHPIDLG